MKSQNPQIWPNFADYLLQPNQTKIEDFDFFKVFPL